MKHIRNSQRLGYEEDTKRHFINVNKCSELDYASHLIKAQMDFEERNKIYRWKIKADLRKFGLENATIKEKNIPYIQNPYESVDWDKLSYNNTKQIFEIKRNGNILGAPKIVSIEVNNYQGIIQIKSLFTDRIEWYLDGIKIKIKYNVSGLFDTTFKVQDLTGSGLRFKLIGTGGETISQIYGLSSLEVL